LFIDLASDTSVCFLLIGVSEREEWGMVCSTRVGQRSAARPGSLSSIHQLSRAFAASKRRLQPVSEAGERPLRPRSVRTAAEL